jgi:hypothetical protein
MIMIHKFIICLFVLQNLNWTEERSPSTKAAKRRKSASKPVEETQPRVFAPGQDLRLLTKAAKEGGIVHTIQPLFVPEVIARCGMRWWNAHCNSQVTNVLREVVVKNNLGQFGSSYDTLREAKGRVRQLEDHHNDVQQKHSAKRHHQKVSSRGGNSLPGRQLQQQLTQSGAGHCLTQ